MPVVLLGEYERAQTSEISHGGGLSKIRAGVSQGPGAFPCNKRKKKGETERSRIMPLPNIYFRRWMNFL